MKESKLGSTAATGGVVRVHALDAARGDDMTWLTSAGLTVVVVGASGDLAKKKTYPSLLNLWDDNLLPKDTVIWGYARSSLTDEGLRDRLRPFLLKTNHSPAVVEKFLSMCRYQGGQDYGDLDAFTKLKEHMETHEAENPENEQFNRLFYFAIPPNVFAATGIAVRKTCMQDPSKGFTRIIVEKPFGRDSESFEELNKTLAQNFTEDHLYRIDHYLGKEIVQALTILRFSNTWFERVWDTQNIQCVMLTFKEPFGTEGRGGYFDQYGIIRDILQNHLLQVLTLLAMEPPVVLQGPGAGKAIRDAKVAVLNAMSEIKLEDTILGQYEGYADDPTIENKDTNTPTFAVIRCWVHTRRWHGVPFILKAGKALNERKAEIRIQFKDPPASGFLFQGQDCPRNELVMRLQPHEAIYIKTNTKSPGFAAKPIQSELEVNYETRFFAHSLESNPDAYTRLILDVLQGKHAAFVRDDELRRAWEIFTPVLQRIENENVRPITYRQGSRGPAEADEFIRREAGYIRNEDYVFYEGGVSRKTEGSEDPSIAIPDWPVPVAVPEEEKADIGLWGLAVMGQNLALNMASHGFKVCVGNRSFQKVGVTLERAKNEGNLPLVGSAGHGDFVARLKKPRKVVILVQAGTPVDETISCLAAYMDPGDLIVDGGDEWFRNSIRRAKYLQNKNIKFVGLGISGGEEGARNGPSLMAGGSADAYDMLAPIFRKCAAQVESTGPSCGLLGGVGTGDYCKIVHNGIEYGDMQLIAEVYDVLKNIVGMSNEDMADLFEDWNKTELDSYLIEITAKILRKKDDLTGDGYVVDHVVDKIGMKGTGRWAVQEAAERRIAVPTSGAALDTRMISAFKEHREMASKSLDAPDIAPFKKEEVISDLAAALYASKVCLYAQGLSLIKAASDEFGWNIDLSECARLWTGGCIIRAALVEKIHHAFARDRNLPSLLLDSGFVAELNNRAAAWRRIVALCVTSGISCPSLCASLNYFDTYRRARLPANLTQAQRDFFGAHTYERVGMEGRYHTAWTDAHKDIGDASQRTAGEKFIPK